jgi:hypothetical protein
VRRYGNYINRSVDMLILNEGRTLTSPTDRAIERTTDTLPAPAAFTRAMEDYWRGTLQNVPNDALREVWRTMGETFNRTITDHGTPSGNIWRIVKPCCGTGKSRGAMLYASMLQNDEHHPGVLLIVRLIRQADQAAEVINELAGAKVAVASHSENRVPTDLLQETPVVVISHAAFEKGLQNLNDGTSRWNSFTTWKHGPRRLTIVDESLSVTKDVRISLDDLSHVKRVIDWKLRQEFPIQTAVVDKFEEVLIAVAMRAEETRTADRQIWNASGRFDGCTSMEPLIEALAGRRLDQKLLRRTDPTENQRFIDRAADTLRGIGKARSGWTTFSKRFDEPAYHTAWSILPEDIGGAVILDATASSDRVYDLLGGKAQVVQTAGQPRDYGNVTLHVSRGHKVGKVFMEANAKEEARSLLELLDKSAISKSSRVLVITHIGVEPHLTGLATGFQAFEVAHWGALDGVNDYQDFDVVVVHGLPYRDPLWSANTFFAHQGPQQPEWMDKDADRCFAGHKDIRKALEVGNLVVQVVQGVNRIRMRRVADNDGGCLPCSIYLSLPNDSLAEEALRGIIDELNNVKVVDWVERTTEGRLKKPIRSNHGAAILAWMKAARTGKYAATTIRKELGIGQQTWERQVAAMRDPTSALYNQLAEASTHYQVEGRGVKRRAYLIKEG